MNFPTTRIYPILAATAIALLSGCGDGGEEIRVYKIAHPEGHDPHAGHDHGDDHSGHDHAPPAATPSPSNASSSVNPSSSMNALPGMESTASAIETPDWVVPSTWETLAPTPIRKGNFKITDGPAVVEITVTAFPGDVGGLEANINRWRGQIGLPQLPLASLEDNILPIEVDGQPAYEVILLNPDNSSAPGIRGAVIPHDGQTWFVKMIGSQAILQNQDGDLRSFLESISF